MTSTNSTSTILESNTTAISNSTSTILDNVDTTTIEDSTSTLRENVNTTAISAAYNTNEVLRAYNDSNFNMTTAEILYYLNG